MKSTTPISDIKAKAKDALLGNYSLAIGSFVLLFAFIYMVINLFSSLAGLLAFGNNASTFYVESQLSAINTNPRMTLLFDVLVYIIVAVATPVIALFTTGYLYICREIAYGRRTRSGDIFYAFRNHPDRVIKISLILYVIQLLCELPSICYGILTNAAADSSITFIINSALTLLGAVLYFIISLSFSMTYLVYLDSSENSALYCIKESVNLMKGNIFKYFCMLLSFIGYYVLVILSLGLALLWVIPYQKVAIIEFYKDLRGRYSVDYRV